MKAKFVSLAILFLLSLNTSLAYSFNLSLSEEIQQESSLKYLYDRNIAIGIALLKTKNYSEAEFEFEKAKFLFPELPESYMNLAIIHINRGQYGQAKKELSQAKKLAGQDHPERYIILYNLGLCAYQEENYQQAVDYFSQCLKLKPRLREATYGLDLALDKVSEELEPSSPQIAAKVVYGQKLDEISEGLSRSPKERKILEASNLLEKASAHFKNNETEKATQFFKQSISLDPNNSQAHYRLGVIYAYLSDFDKAAASFKEATKQDPTFIKAYINLGAAYGKLKDYNKAIKALNKALKIDKNNAKVYYNLGMISSGMGKANKAKKYFKKSRALAHKSNDTLLLQKIPTL